MAKSGFIDEPAQLRGRWSQGNDAAGWRDDVWSRSDLAALLLAYSVLIVIATPMYPRMTE